VHKEEAQRRKAAPQWGQTTTNIFPAGFTKQLQTTKHYQNPLRSSFREQHRTLEQQEKGKKELALQKKVQHLKDTYADWIKQFYEIAERKVSLRDDYGDENWDVASAVQFYSADEGWVITNSTFTKSAKELAQKGINLIDGYDLSRFAEKYATMPKKNIPSD